MRRVRRSCDRNSWPCTPNAHVRSQQGADRGGTGRVMEAWNKIAELVQFYSVQ